MTASADKIGLSRDQLRNVLAAARNNAPVDDSHVEAVEYDWKRPHQFSDTHRVILSQFCKQLGGDLAELFSTLCNDPSRVVIPKVREYYCDGLKKELCEGKKNYYVVFADDKNREIGALIIPYLSAIQWTAKMLGDTSPDVSEEYQMSNLEESLLIDFCGNLLDTFSDLLVKHEQEGVHSLSVLTDRDWPIECLDYEEFSLLQLQLEHSEGASEASLVILTSHFAGMLEMDLPEESQVKTEQSRQAVISNLKKIPVEVDVLLGKATVSMSSLMNLSEGDVLVLDSKASEPVNALIEGKVFFHGYPAKMLNMYALAVSDMIEPGDEINN